MRTPVIALAVGVTLLPADAWPCRKVDPPFDEAVRSASVVLVGTVVSVREGGPLARLPKSKELVALVKVERALKGSNAGTVEVRGDTSSCGWRPRPGMRFLLFAGGTPLGTSLLQPNRYLKTDADRDKAIRDVLAVLDAAGAGGPAPR